LLLGVLPALLVLAADIQFRPARRYLLESLGLIVVMLAVAITLLYSNYNAIHRAGNVSNKYIVYSLVPINIISGSVNVATKALRPYLRRDARNIEIEGRVTRPGNLVVVLAVGESSRKKNFSLYGYERQTNPMLQKIGGLHLLDGIARRGSTLYALPQILEKNGIKLPMMVSRMGIPTSCLVNYTLYDNCAVPGETKVGNCRHGKCYDEDVLPLLESDLKSYQSGYRFIVLHLGGGSHGPLYGDRHPPQFLRFQPTCNDADVATKCTLAQVYNSYDNTILYVDHVLDLVIRALDRRAVPYVLIYLSDHGESLMENGVMFHGMPPGVDLPDEQAQIPLIVKSSLPIAIEPRPEYSQPDVFDTVLDLFSIQSENFDKRGSFIKSQPAPAVE
jgi:lipid A ethanolaminephosphotransferase